MLLGYAGLIPFVGLAIRAIAGPMEWRTGASTGLLVYGVSILSFMGGCRWGFAAAGLGQGPTLAPLAISVLPALLAWAVMALLPAFNGPPPDLEPFMPGSRGAAVAVFAAGTGALALLFWGVALLFGRRTG